MYRNYHSTYDAHDLHKHFMDLVKRNGYKEDTPVWVIRNSYRILDFSFLKPDSVLFWQTTALDLHKELLKERNDLNSGRGHKNKPAG